MKLPQGALPRMQIASQPVARLLQIHSHQKKLKSLHEAWARILLLGCLTFAGAMFSGATASAAECATHNCPPASNERITCPLPVTGTPERHGVDPTSPVTLDVKQWFMDAAGNLDLAGGVELRQGERVVRAPEMHGDSDGNWIIPGKVELADPNLIVSGQGAQAATRAGTVEFEATSFELPARFGRGSASHIRLTQEGEVDLHTVRYTTCPGPKPDWEIKAGQLHIDSEAHNGTARNVQLYFKGVPIFPIPFAPVPFPYFSFPVGDERKTGFLMPDFGQSSRTGYVLAAPVYWNIAPNYDAFITPTWYSERGIDLGAKFRFLTQTSRGEVSANYLPHDNETGEDRRFFELHDQTDFTEHLRFTAEGSKVSDNQWLEDFGSGVQRIGVVVLPRAARMTYRGIHWSLGALAQNYQTVDPDIALDAQPYTLLPQIALRSWFPDRWHRLGIGITGEYSHFKSATGSNAAPGQRVDFIPELRMPLRHSSFYVEPAAAWRYTAYQLESPVAGSSDQTPSRSAPILSLDSGVVFERFTGSQQQRIQTLEPRLLYLYVPYRQQDHLPIFDTTVSDFNLIQLYNTNRFTGPDRLGDANQVAMGITSRLLDTDSGTQYLAATLGEIYRFAAQCVTLAVPPTNTTAACNAQSRDTAQNGGKSDLIGELRLGEYKNWNAGIGLQWNPNTDALERTEVSVQYIPGAGRVINAGYVYRKAEAAQPTQTQQPDLNQIDLSAAWPVGNRVNLFAHYVFSLDDRKTPNTNEGQTIDALAGLEYRDCCWGFRFGARRVINSSGELETAWQWQVELNGLADVGSASDAFLSQAIRGYSAARFDRRSVP